MPRKPKAQPSTPAQTVNAMMASHGLSVVHQAAVLLITDSGFVEAKDAVVITGSINPELRARLEQVGAAALLAQVREIVAGPSEPRRPDLADHDLPEGPFGD